MGFTVPGMTEIGTDWRVVDGVATAWFDAPSLIEGAALAGRIVELSAEIVVDLRATGMRVRLDSDEHAEAVSTAARGSRAGREPCRAAAPERRVRIREPDCGEAASGSACSTTRLGRTAVWRIRCGATPRYGSGSRRSRGRFETASTSTWCGRPRRSSRRVLVRHPDRSGSATPTPTATRSTWCRATALGERIGTADWQAVFSAMTCYRTSSPTQQRRPGRRSSGAGRRHGLPAAGRPAPRARDHRQRQGPVGGRRPRPRARLHRPRRKPPDRCPRTRGHRGSELPRFAQLFLDAADVAAVRAFWVAALGYTHDRRAGVIDIHDPGRLNPVLVFQELDALETERRRQRNRIHFELAVPSDLAQTRLATTVAAGGRLLDESEDRWRVADPEGNEMVIVSGA